VHLRVTHPLRCRLCSPADARACSPAQRAGGVRSPACPPNQGRHPARRIVHDLCPPGRQQAFPEVVVLLHVVLFASFPACPSQQKRRYQCRRLGSLRLFQRRRRQRGAAPVPVGDCFFKQYHTRASPVQPQQLLVAPP
jgi:hypothetical protein